MQLWISNGKQIIKTEYDYVNPGTTNNNYCSSSGEFGAAGGGSISMDQAESVFTLLRKNAVNKARRNAVPNNANILTDVYGGNIDSAKQYMANMAKEIDPR